MVDIEPYLRVRAAAGASFRRDGGRIIYRSNESGLTQLWMLDVLTGESQQRTFGDDRVMFSQFSPTSNAYAYGTDVGGNERCQMFYVPEDGAPAIPLVHDLDVIHSWGQWSPDGQSVAFSSNQRDRSFFDVYVLSITDSEPRMVMKDDASNHVVAWSPDSDALIVSRSTSSSNNDLYLVSVATGEVTHLTPHDGDARFGAVDWLPGQKRLTLATDLNRERHALATLDLDSRLLALSAKPEWGVEAARLSPDGRLLAWRINEDGYSRLRIRDLANNVDLETPEIPEGVISDTRWSPDSRSYAFTVSAYNQNSDIWLLDLPSHSVRRITQSSLAGLDPASFEPPTLVRFKSFDGLQITASLYRPRGATGPLPVIVSVHGGPESQDRPGFNPLAQYFLQRGFAYLAPNVRGSTGYGRTYVHLDDVRRRMDSVEDLRSSWSWLVDSGIGQPDSIAIMGGSYGGFMVLAALTTQPELWAAGVDIVGIANFVTFLENTGAYRRSLRQAEYGSLENDREFLTSISPIHAIDRIRAPLMVIHGANDPRVPVGEAEQIVSGLRARGAPVEYMRFEDEGHGLIRLENRLIAYPAIASFLDRVIGPNAARPG